jgi:hypothetical protein
MEALEKTLGCVAFVILDGVLGYYADMFKQRWLVGLERRLFPGTPSLPPGLDALPAVIIFEVCRFLGWWQHVLSSQLYENYRMRPPDPSSGAAILRK